MPLPLPSSALLSYARAVPRVARYWMTPLHASPALFLVKRVGLTARVSLSCAAHQL
jgi:hypothetical protein